MNEKSEILDKKILKDPTCYKCDCSTHCSIGRPNKELENCPTKISAEIQKKAINLYETDQFVRKSNLTSTIAKYQGSVPRLKDTIE